MIHDRTMEHAEANRNVNTRNIAPVGEAPVFAGPCGESGCDCEGWDDDGGTGTCACSHSLKAHQ